MNLDEHHYLARVYRDGRLTHALCRETSSGIVAWLTTMTGTKTPVYTATLECVTKGECFRCNPRYEGR